MIPAKYYLKLKPAADHSNLVHRDGCPFLPGREERIFLGEFKNAEEPVNLSRQFGMNTRICRFCCFEEHETDLPETMPLIRKVPEEQWDSFFVSSVN